MFPLEDFFFKKMVLNENFSFRAFAQQSWPFLRVGALKHCYKRTSSGRKFNKLAAEVGAKNWKVPTTLSRTF